MIKSDQQLNLEKVNEEIIRCKICPIGKSGKPVVGEGNPNADIVFIGEAPGKQEAISGRPFIGRSGQLLRNMIREVGLNEADIYITSPVKYLPNSPDGTPGGTPKSSDIAHGRIHLMKQLDIIDPKIIVLLGNSAVKGVLETTIPIIKEHGKIIIKQNKQYLVTIHPAAVLRFPKLRVLMKKDFEILQKANIAKYIIL